MDEIRIAGVILAALELTPAEPADLTAVLLNHSDRQVLFGTRGDGAAGWRGIEKASSGIDGGVVTPLARYLAHHIDQGRVEYWTKVVDRGVSERRYRPLPVTDPAYPSRLREVWDAPPILFHSVAREESAKAADASSGALCAVSRNATTRETQPTRASLAIVGSRQTSPGVLEATERVAADMAAGGVAVISGLAEGVDAAAHRGALAAQGCTLAVMGTGIDLVFPDSHRDLAAAIARTGALVSQFAPPAPRTRTSFLLRNHVIAAMSDATLVMDGDERSGSRYEVERAVAYGRPVFMWAPALTGRAWAQQLTDAGAAQFVESAAQVRQDLTPSPT